MTGGSVTGGLDGGAGVRLLVRDCAGSAAHWYAAPSPERLRHCRRQSGTRRVGRLPTERAGRWGRISPLFCGVSAAQTALAS